MSRLDAAKNPSAPAALVRTLVDDPNNMVANAARERLGLELRPRPGFRVAWRGSDGIGGGHR